MFKKILSIIISAVTVTSFIPNVSAKAEEIERYPYTLFAGSNEEGALTINSNTVCINGNIATNGTISTTAQYFNVNGLKKENTDSEMIYLFDKIDASFFGNGDVESHQDNYCLNALNIDINNPLDIAGTASLTGNINIRTAFRAIEDINLYGEVKNTENSIIFSQYGDINIESTNININGLLYAPYGNINITADNLNINSVIIIADTITITCPNLNCNNSDYFAAFIGNESEEKNIISIDKKDMEYISDEDTYYALSSFKSLTGKLGRADLIESFDIKVFDIIGNQIFYKKLQPETYWTIDDIGLMAGVNEIVLNAVDLNGNVYNKTIKLLIDNTYFLKNLQIDLEDNDEDGLWNYMENYFGTDPDIPDTDGDGLNDYIEILSFGYDPLKVDTDDNGVSDGEEDSDSDGLSNLFEVNEFGSNPIFKDTDHDGLWDQQEFEFGTSPVLNDTDEDDISDYDEYYIFDTDPLKANPSDMLYTKEYSAEDCMVDYDKGLYPTIKFTGDAEAIKTFDINECDHNMYINPSMTGYLGSAYNFVTEGKFDSATLTFTYDPELLFVDDFSEEAFLPTIYYFNEETCELEELENQVRVGNTVTAELQHFSIYLLLNKKEIELFWNSPWVFPQTSVEKKAPEKHIVFLLDKTGSMQDNDPTNIRSKLVEEFAKKLGPQDSIKIYGFFDKKVINYTGYGFVHDIKAITDGVDKFNKKEDKGGTYIANALSTVYNDLLQDKSDFELRKELSADMDSSLEQYIFLLTDGVSSDKVEIDFLNDLLDAKIKVYTVGLGSSVNSYCLRSISDATDGQYYSASVSENLENVYLKFGKDIESNDKNKDGIDDYYEYLMCEGILKTSTGTNVFCGASYQEVMENNDFDGDGLINGDEIWVYAFYSTYPFVKLKSDPTTAYTDKDYYSDYEEHINGTNPRTLSVIMSADDYHTLYQNGRFMCAEAAAEYADASGIKIGFDYFVDVVCCNSPNLFKILTSERGNEQNLIEENERYLGEYLSFMIDNSIDDSFDLEVATQSVDSYKNLLQLIDENITVKITDKVKLGKAREKLKDMNKLINSLKSEIAKGARTKEFNLTKKEVGKIYSELDKEMNVFKSEYAEAKKAYDETMDKAKKRGGKIGGVIDIGLLAAQEASIIKDVRDYTNQLTSYIQFKDLVNELSQSDIDIIAEAASNVYRDIEIREKELIDNHFITCREAADVIYETTNMLVDLGVDKGIEALSANVSGVLTVIKLSGWLLAGQDLGINRENLFTADITRQIVQLSFNKFEIYSKRHINSRKETVYICNVNDGESTQKVRVSNLFLCYALYARSYGESKYLTLCDQHTGIVDKISGHNPLNPNQNKIKQAESNITWLNEKLKEYYNYAA